MIQQSEENNMLTVCDKDTRSMFATLLAERILSRTPHMAIEIRSAVMMLALMVKEETFANPELVEAMDLVLVSFAVEEAMKNVRSN